MDRRRVCESHGSVEVEEATMRIIRIAAAACILTLPILYSQRPISGTILGQVLDLNGVPRPDVEVRLTLRDGAFRTTASDREGVYIFRDLAFGVYRIDLPDAGYAPARAKLTSKKPNAMVDLTPQVVSHAKKGAGRKAAPAPPPPPPSSNSNSRCITTWRSRLSILPQTARRVAAQSCWPITLAATGTRSPN